MNKRAKKLIAMYGKDEGQPWGLIMAEMMLAIWTFWLFFIGLISICDDCTGYVGWIASCVGCVGLFILGGLFLRRMWARWVGAVFTGVIGLCHSFIVAVVIYDAMSDEFYRGGPMIGPLLIAGFTVVSSLRLFFGKEYFVTEDQDAERHERYQQIKDDLLEDGKVTGPKGAYVRHKSWGAGRTTASPRGTEPPKKSGYHGTPWGA